MDRRRLGRTGHYSSVAILGGASFASVSPSETSAGLEAALAAGVNHLDIAPTYGRAIANVGPLLPPVRDRLFIACKTARHSALGVRAQLEESLTALSCDGFDLYQMHGVTDLEDLDTRTEAANEIIRARDEGLCRFAGITGHNVASPLAQTEALRRFDLDTVMFPLSPRLWADATYRADAESLLALCKERDVGVMVIKAVSARPWGERDRSADTWYEPYSTGVEVERGVRFALSIDGVHALCTPGDLAVADLVLRAAGSFSQMDDGEISSAMSEVAEEPLIFPIPDGFGGSRPLP